MTQTDTDALQRAIKYLGAVEVAPGRYAWLGSEPRTKGRWLVGTITPSALGPIAEGTVMVEWWSPEQRFAWRIEPDDGKRHRIRDDAARNCAMNGTTYLRITADLETGEEVPA